MYEDSIYYSETRRWGPNKWQVQSEVAEMKRIGIRTEFLQPFEVIIKACEQWMPDEDALLEDMWRKFDETQDGKVSKVELEDHWYAAC